MASRKSTIRHEKNSIEYAILFLENKNLITFKDCPVNCNLILSNVERSLHHGNQFHAGKPELFPLQDDWKRLP